MINTEYLIDPCSLKFERQKSDVTTSVTRPSVRSESIDSDVAPWLMAGGTPAKQKTPEDDEEYEEEMEEEVYEDENIEHPKTISKASTRSRAQRIASEKEKTVSEKENTITDENNQVSTDDLKVSRTSRSGSQKSLKHASERKRVTSKMSRASLSRTTTREEDEEADSKTDEESQRKSSRMSRRHSSTVLQTDVDKVSNLGSRRASMADLGSRKVSLEEGGSPFKSASGDHLDIYTPEKFVSTGRRSSIAEQTDPASRIASLLKSAQQDDQLSELIQGSRSSSRRQSSVNEHSDLADGRPTASHGSRRKSSTHEQSEVEEGRRSDSHASKQKSKSTLHDQGEVTDEGRTGSHISRRKSTARDAAGKSPLLVEDVDDEFIANESQSRRTSHSGSAHNDDEGRGSRPLLGSASDKRNASRHSIQHPSRKTTQLSQQNDPLSVENTLLPSEDTEEDPFIDAPLTSRDKQRSRTMSRTSQGQVITPFRSFSQQVCPSVVPLLSQ